MKFNKIFLFAAVALASLFTSCSSDDEYQAGKPAGENNVTFIADASYVLASDAKDMQITLHREDSTKAITVPLTVVQGADVFNVPSSVSFEKGKDNATITIGVSDKMELNKNYTLEISIPEEYTNPYKVQTTYPTFVGQIQKEDYAVESKATYYDGFWYADDTYATWAVNLEYSPSQGLYRVKNMFEPEGCDPFYFKWNKETNVVTVTNASGAAVKYVSTSYTYSGNPIVAYVNQAEFTYDPAEKTFTLPFYWYCPALNGGWGIYSCYLVLE